MFLVILGAATRLVDHAPNAVPMAAIALFAAARLPRRWAWMAPVGAMALADAYINLRYGQFPGVLIVSFTSYATFAVIALLGGLLGRKAHPAARIGASLAGSTLFFLTTNFAVWAAQRGTGIGLNYGEGVPGLLECYLAALPFFRNGVVADLIGTVVLFGCSALIAQFAAARKPEPIATELS
jgi:hypothetical protein